MVQRLLMVVVVAVAVLAGCVAAEPGCYSCSYSSHSGSPSRPSHSGHQGNFGHSSPSGHPGKFGDRSGHPSPSGHAGQSGGHRFGFPGALAQAGSFAFSHSSSGSSSFSNAQSFASANSHASSFANSLGGSHGGGRQQVARPSVGHPSSGGGRQPGVRPNIGHPTSCPQCGCGGCGGSCGWCGGNYGRKKRSIDGLMNNTNIQSLYDSISSEDKDQCGLRLVCELAQRDPRDLAEDEVQILLPYRGAGESDGSVYGQYDEAAWHGQEGHACPQQYPLCAFTATQIMV